MYPLRMMRQPLRLALLVTLVVVAMSACGGGGGSAQEQANKPRHLPENNATLRPGEYRSDEFKHSLSFRVGKGWEHVAPELSDKLAISPGGEPGDPLLIFRNLRQVYKPAKGMAAPPAVEAPKDMVGWLQHHPYLKTDKPQPVTVGGVKGEQLEVLIDHLPKNPNVYCDPEPSSCLDIFNLSGDDQIGYFGKNFNKRRVIVLGDVKGDTVVIWYAGPPDTFDKFAHKAQKVVDSVKWSGS